MSTQIKIFGQLAEMIGSDQLVLRDVKDTDLLRKRLISDFPKLADYPFVVAVDKKVINKNITLKAGDEVALLPPFAGG
ncbi:MAG: MoaD/ThiS family protein [Aequorivita sp.]